MLARKAEQAINAARCLRSGAHVGMYAVGTSHPLSKRSFNWMALPRVSLSHGVKYYNLLIEVSSSKFQVSRGKKDPVTN